MPGETTTTHTQASAPLGYDPEEDSQHEVRLDRGETRNLIVPSTANHNRTQGQGGYTFNAYPPDDYEGIVVTVACLRLGEHAHLDVDSGRQTVGRGGKAVIHRGKAGKLCLRWPEWLMMRAVFDAAPGFRIAEVEWPTQGQLNEHVG